MRRKFAVILSGCGHRDGAEITEAVSALIALDEAGATYQIYAPRLSIESKNHVTGDSTGLRDPFVEAARIARGKVKDLKELSEKDYDGLVIPGGMGAAIHLCNWSVKGSSCDVLPEARKAIELFYRAEKPIGAICIAPALVARVLGEYGIMITIGNSAEVAQEISKTGALHEPCKVDDFVSDRQHKIITTPAYMYGDATPNQVFTGIRLAIKELVEMA